MLAMIFAAKLPVNQTSIEFLKLKKNNVGAKGM